MAHRVHEHHWFRNSHVPFSRNRQWRPGAPKARLRLEALEDRCLPSTGPLGPLVQVSSSTTPFTNTSDTVGHFGFAFLNSAVEPRLAVDPNNSLHMVGVWQQDRWSDGASRGIMAGVSTDGGNTWTLTPVTGMSINEGGDTERASDPWVTFAPNGDVYVEALVGNDPELETTHGIYVSKSTDGGFTWGAPTHVIINDDPFNLFNDKPSITADPTNSNNIYAVWDRINFSLGTEPTLFGRSTDGGQTWSTPATIYDPGFFGATIANQIVVLPNGTLVDMFAEFDIDGTSWVKVMRSTDQGVTWSAPTTVAPFLQAFEFDPDTGAPIRAGDIPDIAVNRKTGALYIVYQSGLFSNFAHDDIALTSSTDGGLTWSTPIKVNQTPTNIPINDQQAFTPNVAVANNGKVAVSYYDFRFNTPAAGLSTDYWLDVFAPSDLANGKAAQETRLTNSSFDMEVTPFSNGFFVGDYESLVAGGTNFNSFGAFFAIGNNFDNPSNIMFRDSVGSDSSGTSAQAAAASLTTEKGGSATISVSDARAVPQSSGLQSAAMAANDATGPAHVTTVAALAGHQHSVPDDDAFLTAGWLLEESTFGL